MVSKGALGKELYNRTSSYLNIVDYFDVDLAGYPLDWRSINGYCTFVGGN